jgi:hypothetical protein
VVVEHRLARLGQLGVGQARYRGRRKTRFQLLVLATLANLRCQRRRRDSRCRRGKGCNRARRGCRRLVNAGGLAALSASFRAWWSASARARGRRSRCAVWRRCSSCPAAWGREQRLRRDCAMRSGCELPARGSALAALVGLAAIWYAPAGRSAQQSEYHDERHEHFDHRNPRSRMPWGRACAWSIATVGSVVIVVDPHRLPTADRAPRSARLWSAARQSRE